MREGLDYAWHGDLQPQAFIDAGYSFICRYLSHDPSKDIDAAEAQLLSAAGLDLVLVWETSERRPITGGYAGGKVDAIDAFDRAKELGMPDDRPVYFAVDYDVVADAADPYFKGIKAAGFPAERVGVYAGIKPLRHLLDVGLATWGWQTSAWSAGKWDPRAHIQQYKYGLRFPGVSSSDANHAPFEDFGQWNLRGEQMTKREQQALAYTLVRTLSNQFDIAILSAQVAGNAGEVTRLQAKKAADVAKEREAYKDWLAG